MASGDRSTLIVRLPIELRQLIERYQNDRRLPSINAAIIELVESSPGIASTLESVYDAAKSLTTS